MPSSAASSHRIVTVISCEGPHWLLEAVSSSKCISSFIHCNFPPAHIQPSINQIACELAGSLRAKKKNLKASAAQEPHAVPQELQEDSAALPVKTRTSIYTEVDNKHLGCQQYRCDIMDKEHDDVDQPWIQFTASEASLPQGYILTFSPP